MKRWLRISPFALLFLLGVGLALRPGLSGAGRAQAEMEQESVRNDYAQYRQDSALLADILREINASYYRPVDIHEVTVSGLKGMMGQLDPYSEFYVQEQDEGAVADLQITTEGKYSGIGATIGRQGDNLVIVSPMKASPAERTGLQAGDAVMQIDGTPSRSFSTAKAASLIKGPEGTVVKLLIVREGYPEAMEFDITRETIEVNDVSAATFAAPGIAYIEIGRFTRNTGRFLVEAIQKLAEQHKVEGIVLDLRGNPGGLLDEALAVAEPFLPPGEMVVFTKGRIRGMNQKYRTREQQVVTGQLAVLVNGASASASEIVAGAMQDLDRGVIVGQNSFGKGLVQSVAPLPTPPGAYIRLTTGEYFTPSGRNLQRPFVKDDWGHLTLPVPGTPDTTEHPAFKSKNGRTVTGGGGVTPDIEAEGITGNILLFDLKFRRGMFLRYVNNYVNTRNIAQGASVTVDDALLSDFRQWCLDENFTFQTATEVRLEDLKRTASVEETAVALSTQIAALGRAIAAQKKKMWDESRESIALELRREFVTRLQGYDAGQLEYMKKDPQFQAALKILQEPARYGAILQGNDPSGS